MLNVVIDRQRWLRGEGNDSSYLLRRSDARMCCMGFACLADGATEDMITGQTTVHNLIRANEANEWRPTFKHGIANNLFSLYATNDQQDLDAGERESRIIAYGREVDIEFSFVN